MNCFKFNSLFLNKAINLIKNRRFISALYIAGDKAKENYAVLQPYMDFSETFSHAEIVKENIKQRKLNINFEAIQRKHERYMTILKQKRELENMKENNVKDVKSLTSGNPSVASDLENLKEEGRKIRNQIKNLKEILYSIEEDFIKDYLKIPNYLHEKCPLEYVKILYRHNLPDESLMKNAKFHLDEKKLIDYKNSSCYYLLREAAIFDLEFSLNCTNFIVQNGFTQTANPDFSRRILLEAVYSDNIEQYEEIKEQDELNTAKFNTLHLNGGGSFTSFLGFITKLSIFPSALPLKLVSLGRQYYNENLENSQDKGLFTALQSNAVQVFIATQNGKSADDEMEILLSLAVDIYKKFGIHFRIIYEKASSILPSESLKASIQMFSPYFNDYIEVGHISNYSDYLSKRLLFNIKEGKRYKFPYIVGGPIADVSKILGCLIENNASLTAPNFKPARNAIENFKSLFEIK
ncbi:serine--tRNA synthetase-like protein Slimp [Condylostylus longicornis]|uniref:serine--tRNA synthetase-like protein Slimp n=1 Tax=Condylostylus longicornis TaxID=2530218 RepID=UPI00244E1281|nr:serine--tRNA synthetase-like protein Slimp [Condylostylus longicornis]